MQKLPIYPTPYGTVVERPLSPQGEFEVARPPKLDAGCSPFPVRLIQVETTSICNFRSPAFAAESPSTDRPRKHLSLDKFGRILDSFPDLERVDLQGIGEAFLNPSLIGMVHMAKNRGLEVRTLANETRLTRETAVKTVQSGLDVLTLSLAGVDEMTYGAARHGGTPKTYRRSVKNLIDARALLESRTPKIRALVILSRRNVRRVARFLQLAEELGMDSLTFRGMKAMSNPALDSQVLREEDYAWIRSLPPHRGKLEVVCDFKPRTTEDRRACPWPQNRLYVTVEGDVTPCENHFDARELKLGNLFEQDAMGIWNDLPYRAFRAKLWHGELPHKCKTC